MKIIFIDPICVGLEHIPFNSSLIKTALIAYPDSDIVVYGEKTLVRNISHELNESDNNKISFVDLKIPNRASTPIQRWHIDILNSLLLAKAIRKEKGSEAYVVFLSSRETTIFSAIILKKLTKSKISCILHMELRKIIFRSKNPIARALSLSKIMNYGAINGIRYWVLEKHIMDNIPIYNKQLKKHVDLLPHPISQSKALKKGKKEYQPINIGFLGAATKRKGFDIFIRLSEWSNRNSLRGKINFNAIGKKGDVVESTYCELLNQLPSNDKLHTDTFNSMVGLQDYICVFLDNEKYNLSASGTLLDAVKYGIPIIALKTELLEKFTKGHGSIGYFCQNEENLQEAICKMISEKGGDNLAYHRENIIKLSKSRLPEKLSVYLKENMNKLS